MDSRITRALSKPAVQKVGTPQQWTDYMGPESAAPTTHNARNASLPAREAVDGMMNKFDASLDPIWHELDASGAHVECLPPAVQSIAHTSTAQVRHYKDDATERLPQCTIGLLDKVDNFLYTHSLTGSVWDKKLSVLGGFCQTIPEKHMHEGILSNKPFDIKGVAPTYWQCKGMALHLTLDSAASCGIL